MEGGRFAGCGLSAGRGFGGVHVEGKAERAWEVVGGPGSDTPARSIPA